MAYAISSKNGVKANMSDQPVAASAGGREAPRSLDLNLLIALLAVQNQFLDRQKVIDSFAEWQGLANDRRKQAAHSFADWLVETRGLATTQHEMLTSQLAAYRLPPTNDSADIGVNSLLETSGLESRSLADTEPQSARLTDLAGTVSLAGMPGLGSRGTKRLSADSAGAARRFRVVRLHAEGGLGKVSLAHDEELNREVALKEIKPQFADQDSARNRFVLEAEITGGLEHPGIVPVYSLGVDASGSPFYAMRFIRGDSLKDAIAAFFARHAQDGKLTSGAYQSLEFRRLLGRFVDVCNAIGYAHSRGVLHRDIKPANIMLGKFGETLVVDWGLAKVMGKADQQIEALATAVDDPAAAATQMGHTMGTVAYMSPEQAAGRVDLFSSATDIYLLGATLYHLLTGNGPHRGSDRPRLLQQIQQQAVANPRQLTKAIPAPLAAICLKAMSLVQADRYLTAQDIAAELEHYLADEPVSAYREPIAVRVRRAIRKRPALTAAFTAALLVGMIGFGCGYVILGSKNKELASSNHQLAKATQLAVANQVAAENNAQEADRRRKEASRLSDFWIKLLHGTDPVGHGAAALIPKTKEQAFTVGDMLQAGAQQMVVDDSLQEYPLSRAAILYTMGDVNRQLGRYDDALPLLAESLKIRRETLPPNSPDLAASCNAMGCYYQERGEYPKADQLFAEAAAIRRQIDTDEGRHDLATTLWNLGAMRGHEGSFAESEKLYREVIAIREQLPGEHHLDIAIGKMGLAFTLLEQHQNQEALKLIADSQAAFKAVEGHSSLPSAAISFALGTIGKQTLGNQVAESQMRAALQSISQELDPDSVWAAIVHFELARVLADQNKSTEAEQHFLSSLKICREQIQLRHPRVRMLISEYTQFLAKQKRQAEADALWDEFLAAQLATFGEEHLVMKLARLDHAEYFNFCNRPADEVAELEKLAGAFTNDPTQNLVWHIHLGRAYNHTKNYPAAIQLLRNAPQIEFSRPLTNVEKVHQFDARYWLAGSLVNDKQVAEGVQIYQKLRVEAKDLDSSQSADALNDVLEQLVEVGEAEQNPTLVIEAGAELYKQLGGTTATSPKSLLGGFSNPFASVSEAKLLITTRHKLALAHEALGQFEQALPYWKESVAKGARQFGAEHANTRNRKLLSERCEKMLAEKQRLAGNLALQQSGQMFPRVTASHTSAFDKVERANDGLVNYSPPAFQRWTAYGSKNPTDWLEVEFAEPTSFRKVELAIYHEGEKGGVQTPAAFHAEVWDGTAWMRIADQRFTPEKPAGNQWNSLEFEPIVAKRVRVVFTHAPTDEVPHAKSGISEIAIWP